MFWACAGCTMDWPGVREPFSAWTHFAWMLLTLPATWALWQMARGSSLKRAGVFVFGLTLFLCYAGSWLYHSVPADLAGLFAKVDHVCIFLLIAGTTTPIGLVVLSGWWRRGLLASIWALAAVGIGARLTSDLSIPELSAFYVVMGWVGLAMYFELARRLSHARVRALWIGGLFYSVGALLNCLGWPVVVPGVVESHEVFHLFVMAGSAWHYCFIRDAVLGYRG
jgi:hemolysin III